MDGRRTQSARDPLHIQAPASATPASRASPAQAYQVILYNRALHPELFQLRARRVTRRGEFEFESWVMHGMHVLRFCRADRCACELLTDQDRSPASGVVAAFLCAGERDFEQEVHAGLTYLTSVQTETLSENVYDSTYAELADLARDSAALAIRWTDQVGKCLSIIDIQEYNEEVHAQCYHMVAQGGLVIRTQTIFELTD